MNMEKVTAAACAASRAAATATREQKDRVLACMRGKLREHKGDLLQANRGDLEAARQNGVAPMKSTPSRSKLKDVYQMWRFVRWFTSAP